MTCVEFSRHICDNCATDYDKQRITRQQEQTKKFLEAMDNSIKYMHICPDCLETEQQKINNNSIGPIFRDCISKRLPLTQAQIEDGINNNMTYDEYRAAM